MRNKNFTVNILIVFTLEAIHIESFKLYIVYSMLE